MDFPHCLDDHIPGYLTLESDSRYKAMKYTNHIQDHIDVSPKSFLI